MPGDQLADAVAVLLEHHVALGLADPLQDHLLGGLRGDPAEVVRGDVLGLDLVLVLLELLEVDLGLGRLAHLAGLGVDRRLLSGVASTSSCSSSSGGIFSSHTLKSPLSRSISTFA